MTESWTRRDLLRRSAALGLLAVGASACSTSISGTAIPVSPLPTSRRAGGTLGQAQEAGVITVASVPSAWPFCYQDAGTLTGEAVEVARTVCQNLGIPKVNFVLVEYEQLLVKLAVGGFGFAADGMYLTKNNCHGGITFSEPDFVSPSALMVPKGNPKQLHSFADVARANGSVAVLPPPAPEQNYAVAAGIKNIQVLNNPTQLVNLVSAGTVDCSASDEITLKSFAHAFPGNVDITAPFTVSGQLPAAGAFAFPATAKDLASAFNTELRKLHSSGQWLTLAAPFGFTADNVPPAGLTTAQLCAR